ncbi:MAG: thiamine pyrophosphate-binding protein [Sulfolobales archaeon]|nr:thiamine pyrophosphate-binding protein [Sulfolobales archaeon]
MAQAPKRKEETVGKEMTGDEALAYVLHELKISKTFVSPEVPDFLREKLKGNHVEMVEAPSPRDAVILADSYARSGNDLGVALVFPGARILEAIDVIAQAYSDSVPLLIIGTLRSYRDTGRARLNELRTQDDVMASLAPFVKTRERVVTIEEITEVLEKAWKEALSNRPRPVYVEIAEDLFRLKAYPLATAGQKVEKRTPDKATAAKVAELLVNSSNPVIVAGYGVLASQAWDSVKELAELLDIPVVTTIRGKGSIPASHPLFAGEGLGLFASEGASHFLDKADVVLAVGTRFTQASTGGWSFKFKGYVVHNNIDGEDVGKVIVPQVPAIADANLFLREVIANVRQKVKEPIDRGTKSEVFAYRKPPSSESHSGLWPIDVLYALNKTGYEKVYVDLSSTTFDLIRLPIERPFQWVTSETVLTPSVAVGGVVLSRNPNVVGVTTLEGALRNFGLLRSFMNVAKGKLIIANDGGSTYLDTFRSDVPSVGRKGKPNYMDEVLEGSFKAVTVETYGELVSALSEPSDSLVVINAKLAEGFKSTVLPS